METRGHPRQRPSENTGPVQCHALTLLDRSDQLRTELLGSVGNAGGMVDDLAVMIYLVGVTIPRYSLQQAFVISGVVQLPFLCASDSVLSLRAEKSTLTAMPE